MDSKYDDAFSDWFYSLDDSIIRHSQLADLLKLAFLEGGTFALKDLENEGS